MSENNLNDTLAEAVQKMIKATEDGVAFLASELPDFINQLLLWKAAESFIWFMFYMSIAITILVVYRNRLVAWATRHSEDSDAFSWFLAGILFVVGIASFLTALHQTDWLQIMLAPKVYLIEYMARMTQ